MNLVERRRNFAPGRNAPPPAPLVDRETFQRWVVDQERRYEWVDGKIVMMADASRGHRADRDEPCCRAGRGPRPRPLRDRVIRLRREHAIVASLPGRPRRAGEPRPEGPHERESDLYRRSDVALDRDR